MNFTREFFEKFLPPLVHEKREDDFIKCLPGLQSVTDYEAQFTKLSRFAPDLVTTEPRRIRRFIQGLNLEIQKGLAAVPIGSFSEAIEKAQRIENTKAQLKLFNARKKNVPSSSQGPMEASAPSSKFVRSTSGVGASGVFRGALFRRGVC